MAFGRGEGNERMIAVVPRWLGRLDGPPTDSRHWSGTVLPLPQGWPGRWRCALSGRALDAREQGLPVAELFAVLPVALLLAEPAA